MGYNDNIKVAKHGNCKVNGHDSQKYRLFCSWGELNIPQVPISSNKDAMSQTFKGHLVHLIFQMNKGANQAEHSPPWIQPNILDNFNFPSGFGS